MYIIITASPNTDGLTAACGKAAHEGIKSAGRDAEIIDICAEKIKPCLICKNSELIFGYEDKGWGSTPMMYNTDKIKRSFGLEFSGDAEIRKHVKWNLSQYKK